MRLADGRSAPQCATRAAHRALAPGWTPERAGVAARLDAHRIDRPQARAIGALLDPRLGLRRLSDHTLLGSALPLPRPSPITIERIVYRRGRGSATPVLEELPATQNCRAGRETRKRTPKCDRTSPLAAAEG
jgi:hypothetical protein